jgi:ribosomal protein S18 acetylase RimI-like enzyme
MTMSSEIADIVPYRPEFREAFERLNRIWLEGHSLLEPADLECLTDPQNYVLSKGGQVFFALDGGNVVGTCAAIPVTPSSVELAKLTVAAEARGKGIARRLCGRVIEFCREAGASEVVLTSNSALVEAIALYESLGFRHAAVPDTIPYVTADVYMTLSLV